MKDKRESIYEECQHCLAFYDIERWGNPVVWSAITGRSHVHDLEEDHLINIVRYLHWTAISDFVTGNYDERKKIRYEYQVDLIEFEIKRRGLDLEEILTTLEHPEPEEFIKKNPKKKK